jgi:Peptidase family M1 domain
MKKWLLLALVLVCLPGRALAQSEPLAAVWNQLSAAPMDPAKTAMTENVEIVRDRVHITLAKGSIQFTKPTDGVVFGAIFQGEGLLRVDSPNAIEAQQLKFFTLDNKLEMTFSEATFSFTDGLFDEVSRQVKWGGAGPRDGQLYVKRQEVHEDFGGEYQVRLLKSVLSPDRKRTAYFLADLMTQKKGWVEVRYDAMQPEEVRVGQWGEERSYSLLNYWMLFPAGNRDPRTAYEDPAARVDFLVSAYEINTQLFDNADIMATTRVTISPRYDGEKLLLFSLDSNARISSIKDGQGRALEFVQARERKDSAQSYGDYVALFLKEPTKAGENQTLEFAYAGKRIVYKVGEGNYFCRSFGWYPTRFSPELGVEHAAFRADYKLAFRSPKKYTLVATGHKVSESTDGKDAVSTWQSDIPLAYAGFAFGDYKVVSDKLGDIEINVYANNRPDDQLTTMQRHFDNPSIARDSSGMDRSEQMPAVGHLVPSNLAKTISGETSNTLKLFQDYFGPYPYKQLAVTNIFGSYGQGWPGLLYLSWLTFMDPTQLHLLGVTRQAQITDFFRAHESSHQWWGQKVGWKSYHDQWLSEGFAEFSGDLYVQYRRSPTAFVEQLRHDKDLLKTGDIHSHRVDSIGPIWLGRRVISTETSGTTYQNLIYSKGAYVLQMLRTQMADPRNQDIDHLFKEMMKDYCNTYADQAASTEDFKKIVEKHMTPTMDLERNHRMDWFFNEYVYGTGIPQYFFHATLSPAADGKTTVDGELTRGAVPDNWKDAVPVYVHMGDKVIPVGLIAATHPIEKIHFVLPQKVDKVTIAEFEDILADVKQ